MEALGKARSQRQRRGSGRRRLNLYYVYVWGKTVIGRIYPTGPNSNCGYAEFVYHWGVDQKMAAK
jgi:hypothetical protein